MILLEPRDWRKLEGEMKDLASEHGVTAEIFDIDYEGPYQIYYADALDPDEPAVLTVISGNQTVCRPCVMSLNQAREMIARWERDAMTGAGE